MDGRDLEALISPTPHEKYPMSPEQRQKAREQKLEEMIGYLENSTGMTRPEIKQALATALHEPTGRLQVTGHLIPRHELPYRVRVGLWLDDRIGNLVVGVFEGFMAWKYRKDAPR